LLAAFVVVVLFPPPPPPPQPAATSVMLAAAASRTAIVRVLDLKMCPPLLPIVIPGRSIVLPRPAILERRAAAL
jgi:hypothetical protein